MGRIDWFRGISHLLPQLDFAGFDTNGLTDMPHPWDHYGKSSGFCMGWFLYQTTLLAPNRSGSRHDFWIFVLETDPLT